MSSSGLIYAGIVGAWAVYLVPVWLRREEQLNEAREKARYAAAIRTLGRSERFEKKVLAEEALAATGTDGAGLDGPPRPRSTDSGRSTDNPRSGDGRTGDGRAAEKSTPGKPTLRKTAVLPPAENGKQAPEPAGQQSIPAARPRKSVAARLPHHPQTPAAKTSAAATAARRRGVLLMRRRRVVAALFMLATLGAIVSTFQGLDYIWAMLAPAALFSGYVVYIRSDEKQRARERYRRRQALLAADRRRERERQRQSQTQGRAEGQGAKRNAAPSPADPKVHEPESTVWRPAQAPHEYRRAANG